MINIIEILKKIPNLEDIVFYSPLYGENTKITIENDYIMYIWHTYKNGNTSNINLNMYGCHSSEGECMIYPSKENKDWSTFKSIRKDLPEGTPVIFCSNPKIGWFVGKYYKENTILNLVNVAVKYKYIIPVDKFNFNDLSFKEEDNYGVNNI